MTNPAATQNKEIDCLSPEAQKLAEARLAAKRAARAEAREIRMKELERQQKEVEERPEKDFAEKGSRNLPGLSAATLASLGGTSSRRGSGDTSISVDTEASIREIKDSLAEVEEKYKKAMVSNAQLDNEKMNYMYQVDTLKDTLLELEEQLAESRRLYEDKSKEFEREKHAHGLLQFQFAEVKAALQQREELLQKHGINSETTTNGEAPDTLNNVAYQGPTKTTKEELNALKVTGDGTLGKATAVEVKKEIVENVGKREILQNTEQEPQKEDPVEDGVDAQVSQPGGSAKDPTASEDSAPSLGTLAPSEEEGQSHMLESASFLEHSEQVGSGEATGAPDARTGAALEQSKCLSDLDGDIPGPVTGQGSRNALDIKNQSEEAAEKQEQEEQDFQTRSGEVSPEPRQGSAPLQLPELDSVSSARGAGGAGPAGRGQLEDTVGSSPPRCGDDTVSHDDRYAVDVPKELDPSGGHGLEKELTNQEVSEPRALPVQSPGAGGENIEAEDEGKGFRNETPVQTDPTSPSSPAASVQEATGPDMVDARGEPLDGKEPSEDRNDHQEEGLDTSPKKTKNKKRKNRKKKSPVEPHKDVQKEFTLPTPDPSDVKQVTSADEKAGVETQNEVAGNPKPNVVAGGSERLGSPGGPGMELDGKLDQEDSDESAEAGRRGLYAEPLLLEGEAASGCRAGVEGMEEGVLTGAAPRALLGDESPSEDITAAPQTEGTEGCVRSEHPSQGARKVLDSISLEDDDLPPARELGDFHSESKGETEGRSEKDRSKEDCTLS